MANDGGSTESAYFRERLEADFGVEKVKMAKDLVPPEIPDANLTGLSAGACYLVEESYSPLYVNRLQARVTLEDTATGDRVGYKPYQHFAPNFNPTESFFSERLPDRAGANARYELTVTDADGDNSKSKRVYFDYAAASNAANRSPRLMIDKLGRIWIEDNGPRGWRWKARPGKPNGSANSFKQSWTGNRNSPGENGNESITWSRKTPSAGTGTW